VGEAEAFITLGLLMIESPDIGDDRLGHLAQHEALA
jgi:hypothetical protein